MPQASRRISPNTARLCGVLLLAAAHAHADPPTLDWPATAVSAGHRFLEGPAVAPDGTVYFTDVPDGEIHVYHPTTGDTTVFNADSNGANGLLFVNDTLYVCEEWSHAITRYTDYQDPTSREVIADQFDGQRLNSPNDLIVTPDGAIHFTDPRYGNRDSMALDVESVYSIPPDTHAVVRQADFVRPNGIMLSTVIDDAFPRPNARAVYISDYGSCEIHRWVWDAAGFADTNQLHQPDDALFAVIDPERGGIDGMCVDATGNLYCTVPAMSLVAVFAPDGTELGRIPLPKGPANITIMPDGRSLYVACVDTLYHVAIGEDFVAQPPAVPTLDWPTEAVSTGHRFTEGPAVAPDGTVYFSDIPDSEILVFHPDIGETTTFTDDSGRSNGLLFHDNTLYACEGGRRAVVRYTDWQDPATREALATHFNGQRFNSPNDLTIHQDWLCFTDPRYGNRDDMEMEREAVYAINMDTLVVAFAAQPVFTRPNGIVTDPELSRLYIADHGEQRLHVVEDDNANSRVIATTDPDRGGIDGMCVDAEGNLYATIPGLSLVAVFAPDGTRLANLPIPEGPANCTLTPDGQTLYVTARTSLYAVEVGDLPALPNPNP